MYYLGLIAAVLLLVVAVSPAQMGKWLALVHNAYDANRETSDAEPID